MSTQDLLPGNRFRLYRESDATPGTFEYVGIGVTVTFHRATTYEDATVADLAVPTAIPTRKSVKKSTSWSMNFSGKVDAALFTKLEGDEGAETAHKYQIAIDLTAANGGRTYTGPLFYETLEMAKNDNGLVTFTAQCRGDGPYVKAAVA